MPLGFPHTSGVAEGLFLSFSVGTHFLQGEARPAQWQIESPRQRKSAWYVALGDFFGGETPKSLARRGLFIKGRPH